MTTAVFYLSAQIGLFSPIGNTYTNQVNLADATGTKISIPSVVYSFYTPANVLLNSYTVFSSPSGVAGSPGSANEVVATTVVIPCTVIISYSNVVKPMTTALTGSTAFSVTIPSTTSGSSVIATLSYTTEIASKTQRVSYPTADFTEILITSSPHSTAPGAIPEFDLFCKGLGYYSLLPTKASLPAPVVAPEHIGFYIRFCNNLTTDDFVVDVNLSNEASSTSPAAVLTANSFDMFSLKHFRVQRQSVYTFYLPASPTGTPNPTFIISAVANDLYSATVPLWSQQFTNNAIIANDGRVIGSLSYVTGTCDPCTTIQQGFLLFFVMSPPSS